MANWSSGSFSMPTSTGLFSVTGIPFRPQGIFFAGTNITTEDTVAVAANPALFFSMVWHDYLTGLPDSQCVCNRMGAGINVKPHPIVMTDSLGCSEEYAAELSSINDDGFTLNVTNAAPANRVIIWMAYGGFTVHGGSADLGDAFYTVGGKILTNFAMNYRTSGGIRDGCENALYNTMYIGANSMPTVDNPPTYNTRFWGSAGFSHFPTTGGQGFTRSDWNINPSPFFQSAINISTGDFPPIVLEDRIQLWRQSDTQIGTAIGGGPLRWFAQWWNAENYTDNHTPPSTVGATNVWTSGNPFLTDIQGAMYAGILGDQVQTSAARGRFGVGFITEDGQGSIAANDTGYAWQSRQYGLINRCDNLGALASSCELENDHINVTTEINTSLVAAFSEGGFFAWGPAAGGWIPQIYRRWPY